MSRALILRCLPIIGFIIIILTQTLSGAAAHKCSDTIIGNGILGINGAL